MPNLMQNAATWLAGRLQSVAGRSVVYTTGNSDVTITATPILQEYQVTDPNDGIMSTVQVYEWLITASQLLVDSVQHLPIIEDVIEETLNGKTYIYAVLPVAGRPHFEWVDTSGIMVKVRTKRINSA